MTDPNLSEHIERVRAAQPPLRADAREGSVTGMSEVELPARILLCLGPCHGEFYLPLDLDEHIVCPIDRSHPVAVYQSPTIHAGEEDA